MNLIERENKQGSGCHNHWILFQQKEKMRQGHHQVEANSCDKSAISFMFKFIVT